MLQRGRALSSAEAFWDAEKRRLDYGFNGAALFRARRLKLSPASIFRKCALQRGRALSSAEALGCPSKATNMNFASTGPRSFERGGEALAVTGHGF